MHRKSKTLLVSLLARAVAPCLTHARRNTIRLQSTDQDLAHIDYLAMP